MSTETLIPVLTALYKDIQTRFRAAGVENPGLEARILVKAALGVSDADLITGSAQTYPQADLDRLEGMVARRLAGEPPSRILGSREFWGRDFVLSPDTLDPRADTETLIEAALECFKGREPPKRILDIGTGTGCIAITLLAEWPGATGVATDLSAGAVDTARLNARNNGVDSRIQVVQTRWVDGIDVESGAGFDLIVSNPPYIPSNDIESLDENVRRFDPILALDGGDDGLNAYRDIITETKRLFNPGGIMLWEIGINQLKDIARLVENAGATRGRTWADLGGIPRVVEISHGDK
ncbi:peptide chain release factor N(5)-glutamine methyltransferase [Micavibrio aeruginosavorus]|uniref:peptide chain release factor N(5)-glutamine methyltransferase n=1 Tax=Micavibrio aeruginosavorus TaxID=349221 RepID=UPI003F4AC612